MSVRIDWQEVGNLLADVSGWQQLDHFMGHPIYLLHGQWYYVDTREPCENERSCLTCGLTRTDKNHDPCIADLPKVRHACCGHGVESMPYGGATGYVGLNDGRCIYFSGFTGEQVKELVRSALAGEPIPEDLRVTHGAWWAGLTDKQYRNVWARIRADNMYGTIEELVEKMKVIWPADEYPDEA